MQAVILAAGKGSRMGSLTADLPKPMLTVAGKNLLEHKLDILPREVDQVIVVVGYLGNHIKDYFGTRCNGISIQYAEQKELLGTGHALWQVQDLLRDRFMVMMGDDIYARQDLEALLRHQYAMTVQQSLAFTGAGNVIADKNGFLKTIDFITETIPQTVAMDTALYMLDTKIFKYKPVQIEGKQEWGLPHTLVKYAPELSIRILESTHWMKINSPEELRMAETIMRKRDF